MLEKCTEDIKRRFSCCKIETLNGKYFYLFDLHLISERINEPRDYVKILNEKYINVLDEITETGNNQKDYSILMGDFNYIIKEEVQNNINTDKEKSEYQKLKDKIMDKIKSYNFVDIWKEQHQGNLNDATFQYQGDLNSGLRLDYSFISERFNKDRDFVFRIYISHETNILWDKYIGFTDHSALVLVF